jgi:CubicO group peptidase (beta-lactamase class C family)
MKIRSTIENVKSTAVFIMAIVLLGQISEPLQAQNRVGRPQSTGTTPPKQKGMSDIADGEVDINFERMGLNLFLALQNNSVGYGVAIFHNGELKKKGSGGYARRSPDTGKGQEIAFQPQSRVDIASCSKTITSIAVLKALEMKGKTDQELIHKYLPFNWKVPASVKKLTFRDVLSHHSGLRKVTDGTYDGVRQSIEAGVAPDYKVDDYDQKDDEYQNINFVLCRVLLPHIISDKVVISDNDPVVGAKVTAEMFVAFVQEHVFIPAGINKAQYKPWDESGSLSKVPLVYSFKDSTVEGFLVRDHTLDCGAGGLFISAVELAQVMAALENGKLLSLNTRMMMKQHDLGIFQVGNSAYWSHSGGFTDSNGRGTSTRLVLCPNNIQVAIVMNSSGNNIKDTFALVKNALEDSMSKP